MLWFIWDDIADVPEKTKPSPIEDAIAYAYPIQS